MKILVIQLKRLGDTLLVTPALAALRQAIPGVHIALATDPVSGSMAHMMPVDEWIIPTKEGLAAWRKLLTSRYDVCLDFSGTDRSAWIASLSGAAKRVTYQRFQKKPLRRWVYNVWVDSSVRDRHTAAHHLDLLHPLGICEQPGPISLRIPSQVEKTVDEKLSKVRGEFAVVHPGSARPEKFWYPDRWAEVIHFLKSEWGLETILTGSPAAGEKRHIAEIVRLHEGAHDWTGTLTLPELTALLRRSRLFCGVDSAPLHLCDAVETPCVGLYGPTNPYHWLPRFTPSRIIRAGVSGDFLPSQQGGGMELISVDQVTSRINDLLAGLRR